MKQYKINHNKSDINSKNYILFIVFSLISIFFLNNRAVYSQQKIELHDYYMLFAPQKNHKHTKAVKYTSKNEIQFISHSLHSIYKNFISSQDENHCFFYPSCSDYAIKSTEKNGVFLGILSAADRLTRCNIHSSKKYPLQEKTGLFIDYP